MKFQLLSILLVLCQTTIMAQHKEEDERLRRFYISLQVASQRYEFLYPSGLPHKPTIGLGKAGVGYHITNRFALQADFVYHHSQIEATGRGTTLAGLPRLSETKSEEWDWAIPILIRYDITAQIKRFHFDLLGGITKVYSRFRSSHSITEGEEITFRSTNAERASATYVTGGVGARYGFGRHRKLETLTDLTLNKNTDKLPQAVHNRLDARWGITSALSIGIRYSFK
jgi:hypothetical protein